MSNVSGAVNKVNVYVGSDGKIHFTNGAGADTALNFSKAPTVKSGTFSVTATNGGSVGGTVNLGFKPDVLVYYFLNNNNARLMGFWKSDFGNNFIFHDGNNPASRELASISGYYAVNRGALGSITDTGFTVYGVYGNDTTATYWACKFNN